MIQYSVGRNKWRQYSFLPEGVTGSSGVILDNTTYNIGGYGSHHSILKCDLGSTHKHSWLGIDLSEYGFTEMRHIFSFALNNQIICFRSAYPREALVLEK